MIIQRNRDGSYTASGTCDGVPYVAEGDDRPQAMQQGLLLIERRHLQTVLDQLEERDRC